MVGITLGFDSISGEYARGTLSRVLSQPIYRDSFINGKFLAGLTTVAVLWGSILLLVIGLGITLLGFPPNGEELWRMLIFTTVGIFYVGFWLALAMLFSLLFQKTVTAALGIHGGLAVSLTLFVSVFSSAIAGMIVPGCHDSRGASAPAGYIERNRAASRRARSSTESVGILLNPAARVFGMALQSQAEGILPTPLGSRSELEL